MGGYLFHFTTSIEPTANLAEKTELPLQLENTFLTTVYICLRLFQ
jgi:hypothetical protein